MMQISTKWLRRMLLVLLLLAGCHSRQKVITIYLIGDSTVADYANNYDLDKDYAKTRYPLTGWGQVFQRHFTPEAIDALEGLIHSDSVVIVDRARGGRSTRSFFEEGRWRSVYQSLKPHDVVMMQFGHNDAAVEKTERYVGVEGYKEFLRLFVTQTRQKGAIPIIVSPVARNYPWENGRLKNVHGEYPAAAAEVAREMPALFIDLNQLSMEHFSDKGQEYVSKHYFMNLDSGMYEAYPNGQSDNTHFQPEGADAVAALVLEGMKTLTLNKNE